MSHLLKFTEWESASGWHCGDLSDLAHNSNHWLWVPTMLGISPTDYILMLKDKFNAKNFVYSKDNNVLLWQWENYIDCHNFTKFINAEARRRKYMI